MALMITPRHTLKEPEGGYAIAGFSFTPADLFTAISSALGKDFTFTVDTSVNPHACRFAQVLASRYTLLFLLNLHFPSPGILNFPFFPRPAVARFIVTGSCRTRPRLCPAVVLRAHCGGGCYSPFSISPLLPKSPEAMLPQSPYSVLSPLIKRINYSCSSSSKLRSVLGYVSTSSEISSR